MAGWLSPARVTGFTVNADLGEGNVDWEWLAAQPRVGERGCVYLLRFDEPAVAIMDGRERRGVILRPGSELAGVLG